MKSLLFLEILNKGRISVINVKITKRDRILIGLINNRLAKIRRQNRDRGRSASGCFRCFVREVWAYLDIVAILQQHVNESGLLHDKMSAKTSYKPVQRRSSSELIDVLDSSETSAGGKCSSIWLVLIDSRFQAYKINDAQISYTDKMAIPETPFKVLGICLVFISRRGKR